MIRKLIFRYMSFIMDRRIACQQLLFIIIQGKFLFGPFLNRT